jgi:hypothetical protein
VGTIMDSAKIEELRTLYYELKTVTRNARLDALRLYEIWTLGLSRIFATSLSKISLLP